MKILLIAYACEPNKGSEPGVGWNWAINLSRYAATTVITRKNNRKAISDALKLMEGYKINFIYFDIPFLSKIKNYIPFGVQLYYLIWEYFLYWKVKPLNYDIFQKITFVTTVTTFKYHKINKPYIISFCGGGEETPLHLKTKYSLKNRFLEYTRLIYNSFFIGENYIKSKIVFAVTKETKKLIERKIKKKCFLEPAIGIEPLHNLAKQQTIKNKILYAGNLLYLKNVDILIKAIINVEGVILEIIGQGPELERLREIVIENKIMNKVKFFVPLNQAELLKKLIDYDLVIHASSHDSGSMILLEAINANIPVLFLDTGGPAEIFDDIEYELKVSPFQNYSDIIINYSEKIKWFYKNHDNFLCKFVLLREKVLEKYSWANKAKRMFSVYKEILNENTPSS